MNVLVVDVGGTNVKLSVTGQDEMRKVPSGPDLTPQRLTDDVLPVVKDWSFDAVTVGFPAPMANGKLLREPVNLGKGWIDFDLAKEFGKPTKIINDAAMQALGSYDGGRMFFMGLGTGLGTAFVVDNVVQPLEVAHLPYKKKRSYEDYLGQAGLNRLGKEKWQRHVEIVVELFRQAFLADYIVLGGGNSKKLTQIPPFTRLGDNRNAIIGGIRLWEEDAEHHLPKYEHA
jgi:predicted NBD/HSP70 family sugar kinase